MPLRRGRADRLALDFGGFGFCAGNLRLVWRIILHTFLQRTNALADPLAEFRELLGPEDEQSNKEDHQQVHRLKQTFKHTNLQTAYFTNVTEPGLFRQPAGKSEAGKLPL